MNLILEGMVFLDTIILAIALVSIGVALRKNSV